MLRAVLLICAALSAGLLSGPADARSRDRDRGDATHADSAERREDRRSRDEWLDQREAAREAARLAQIRNGGGRVLSVDPVGGGYRVKVLKDGVVRVYVVDGP